MKLRAISDLVSLPQWPELWSAWERHVAGEFLAASTQEQAAQIHKRLEAGRDFRYFLEREGARDG